MHQLQYMNYEGPWDGNEANVQNMDDKNNVQDMGDNTNGLGMVGKINDQGTSNKNNCWT